MFLSREDLTRLAEELGIAESQVVDRYCVWVPFGPDAHLSLNEEENNDCVFWRDGGCSVYAGRPLQCRAYPFWQTIVDAEEHWLEEAAECPGIGIGRTYGAREIADMVAARRMRPPVLRSEFERSTKR